MLKHAVINKNSVSNVYYSQSLGQKYRQKFGMYVSRRSRFVREDRKGTQPFRDLNFSQSSF